MRPLWFGGSFNPIHHAHLICARSIAQASGFEQVILVPSGQPPHKPADTSIASANHRLAMCRAAVQGDPFFAVDDIEMRRTGPSYTIHTIRQLKTVGLQKISWLIGADMAVHLPRWHESASLLAEVDFVLMARPGWSMDWSTLPEEYRHLQKNVIAGPLIDISSTMLRKRLAAGQSIRYLTPPGVVEYIDENALYRGVTA